MLRPGARLLSRPVARRSFATGPSGAGRRPARRSDNGTAAPLSLEHFLQRGRALALYRTVVRGTQRIGDPATRAETRRFARDEFERNRGVTDLAHIRYLISTGKTEWEAMERYIGGM